MNPVYACRSCGTLLPTPGWCADCADGGCTERDGSAVITTRDVLFAGFLLAVVVVLVCALVLFITTTT